MRKSTPSRKKQGRQSNALSQLYGDATQRVKQALEKYRGYKIPEASRITKRALLESVNFGVSDEEDGEPFTKPYVLLFLAFANIIE